MGQKNLQLALEQFKYASNPRYSGNVDVRLNSINRMKLEANYRRMKNLENQVPGMQRPLSGEVPPVDQGLFLQFKRIKEVLHQQHTLGNLKYKKGKNQPVSNRGEPNEESDLVVRCYI